jgi:hypothetical protein
LNKFSKISNYLPHSTSISTPRCIESIAKNHTPSVTYFIHYYAGDSLKREAVTEEIFDAAPRPVVAGRMRDRKMAIKKQGCS